MNLWWCVFLISFPKPLNDLRARSFSSWWKLEFSPGIVSVLQSPHNAKACRAKYQMLWTGLRAKSFFSCAFLVYIVQIGNHQYHLLLLRVPWHILQLPPYANQTIRAFEILSFFHCIFQLENQFFVKAGSVLDEVSIPLWSVFKQVWQQAASLL